MTSLEYNQWTRICLVGDDFYDVVERYDEVLSQVMSGNAWGNFLTIHNYRLTIKMEEIATFFECGIDILKRVWTSHEELDRAKKSVESPSWE